MVTFPTLPSFPKFVPRPTSPCVLFFFPLSFILLSARHPTAELYVCVPRWIQRTEGAGSFDYLFRFMYGITCFVGHQHESTGHNDTILRRKNIVMMMSLRDQPATFRMDVNSCEDTEGERETGGTPTVAFYYRGLSDPILVDICSQFN